MPASLPGSTLAQNLANPALGKFVIFDPLSGPKGSPLDVRVITGYVAGTPTYANAAATQQPSTGALSTGIGISAEGIIGVSPGIVPALPPYAIFRAGFNDDGVPGNDYTYTAPPPPGSVATNVINSTRMYIGGGRSVIAAGTGANGNGAPANWKVSVPSPYTAGVSIAGAGNGGSRDGGAGPAFTGFGLKMVTAAGAVANGAAIEGAFVNRSGLAMVATQSAFGSSNAALAAAA